MKISHELPLCLLSRSKEWNDYEYLLPTFLSNEKYKEHFVKAKEEGRFIIMDNGLFEGDKFSNEELLELVTEIKPNIFIIPDVWDDAEKTFGNAAFWMKLKKTKKFPKETEIMVVMQGESFPEIGELYNRCKWEGYKHFAINHSSISYQNHGWHPNININQMVGRIQLIGMLQKEKIWEEGHYLHLLGISLPQELSYYEEMNINSVDSSNPIIIGALNKQYESWGLISKPIPKLKEFFEKDLSGQSIDITFNVKQFRQFCK